MNTAVRVLSYSCGGFLALYIALVLATVYFASAETRLSQLVSQNESVVGSLEEEYYDLIATVSSEDPFALGYTSPSKVEYLAAGTRAVSVVRASSAE